MSYPEPPSPGGDFQSGDRITKPMRDGRERVYVVQDPVRTTRGKLRVRRTDSKAIECTTTWWAPERLPSGYHWERPDAPAEPAERVLPSAAERAARTEYERVLATLRSIPTTETERNVILARIVGLLHEELGYRSWQHHRNGDPIVSPWVVTEAPPGTCPMCAFDHDGGDPHDQQSLRYQYAFYVEQHRWPTWADAMAHCDEETRAIWRQALEEKGIDVNAPPTNEGLA